MDIIIKLIEPIITQAIQTAILPIIKANLTKLDVVEDQINAQLSLIATSVKTGIDTIPVIPIVFTADMKQKLIDNIPFDKIDNLLDSIDLTAMIEKIPISAEIDPEGLIKKRLTQFPNEIKEKLKSKIREAFSVKTSSGVISTNPAAEGPAAEGPAAEGPAAEGAAITDTKTVSIKESMNTMTPEKKKEALNKIMIFLKDSGMLEEIKLLICTPAGAVLPPAAGAVLPPAVGAVLPPAAGAVPAAGGSKQKRRRKTKKNIYHRSRGRTQYGRKF